VRRRSTTALSALTDAVVTATREPGDTRTIAARVGTVPCHCLTDGHPGTWSSGAPCTSCRLPEGSDPGWRPATNFDVYPILVRLERAGVITGERVGRVVIWELALQPSPIPVPEP